MAVDGTWTTGAPIDFNLRPVVYRKSWIYVLGALIALALLAGFFKACMNRAAAQVRAQLEEDFAHRERMALELHDALLQDIQGLILRFQAATDHIPNAEPARELMEHALVRADQLLAESRARATDLSATLQTVEPRSGFLS